jgi:endoglucanase
MKQSSSFEILWQAAWKILSIGGILALINCSSVEIPDLPPPNPANSSPSLGGVEGSSSPGESGGNPSPGEAINGSSPSWSSSSRSSSSNGSNTGGNYAGPVSYYGKLQASGNKIVGSKTGSTAVQVRGVSLFWSNTGWGGDAFFNAAAVNAMADNWKAEVIRVPIGYSENGGYKNDASNKTRVKTAINAAIAKGVYVIIDWHSHNAHNETSAAVAYFQEMAQEYGNKEHVIFEIYNEPLDVAWSSIKSYSTTVINTIRNYSSNLILVGTPNWDQDVNSVVGNTLADNNVAYVFHFYAVTHSTSDFGNKIDAVLNAGYPVFVSEYGTVDAGGGCCHDAASSNAWITFLNSRSISYCAWSANNKNEAASFFNPTFTPSASAAWANTSNMTSSGQYIYNNLVSWSSNAPWRSGSGGGSNFGSGGGSGLYCDFGYPTTSGGGCFQIEDASICDTKYGILATSCGRTDFMYCDWGPVEPTYGGGCYIAESESHCKMNEGSYVSKCPASSL